MKTLISTLFLSLALATQSQVVSNFTWSTNLLTLAASGPNATSVSNSAKSEFIGGALQYAINPGLPTANINLVIPGSPTFDIPGIDISLYFRREESVASFFKRGSMMNFGMSSGYITVKFTTTKGSDPGTLAINSGNIVAVPDDHAFHHYRFRYDNNTGIANVWLDGVIVYTYSGIAGRPLSWTGAGNVVIGEEMDATSRNVAVLSNLTVGNVAASILPVNLLEFTAAKNNDKTLLQWSTDNEVNFSHFVVERSADGKEFSSIHTVNTSAASSSVKKYELSDNFPNSGINYYRLKMVDKDGKSEYSATVKIMMPSATTAKISCFPNPAVNYVNINISNAEKGICDYSVSTLQGHVIKAASATLNGASQTLRIDLPGNIPSGILIIKLYNRQTNTTESFKIIKS